MIKLAIDAMGGDFAPYIVIEGVIKALTEDSSLYIYLYGDKYLIEEIIQKKTKINNKILKKIQNKITIVHTPFFLEAGIKHIREELRDNQQHSMFLALRAAQIEEADGVVSAGPTQALILASFLIIKTLKGISRIALAPIFSNLDNKQKILLDAGGNTDLKPEHLVNFAICASIMAQELLKIKKPIVKLLNIGSEKTKGRTFEKNAFHLLEKNNFILFKGNEEPQNILNTEADILLSDGFTSNIVLKSYEGALTITFQAIKKILTKNYLKKIISKILFSKELQKIKKKLDNKEIGGAMLLGLNKIVIKAHGNSNSYAFYNAIKQAKILIQQNFLKKIEKHLITENK
ncbi:phosphate acyltransferase PlsX [Candidatus Phytoplasma pini]|uniref:Phosphate acyltransferase n=1 Tax=Candidatus Phytoplasma pini TaxID=267362 RepID=A0A559KJR4_9MOLU|nr:phosphate acyltransferase PlsX [Candidatus Phytoplasma pini]TVY12372.1 fatty acid/phospholipid synthesis protein PlsX [Candidatus Phytoplasma pini]